MTELTSIEPAKPLRNLLIGIGMPAAVIGLFALGATVIAMVSGHAGWTAVRRAAGAGAFIGALVSFYCLTDIAVAYLLSRGRALDRLLRTVGYVMVWLAAVAAILRWRY